jgi:Cytochrome P460
MILHTRRHIAILSLLLGSGLALAEDKSIHAGPSAAHVDYLPDGSATIPPSYRNWPFLSSGLDMSYPEDGAMTMSQHIFTNVFVDPDSMRTFQATGTWPDGAVLLKEDREGVTKGSINKTGKFQTTQLFGVEMHRLFIFPATSPIPPSYCPNVRESKANGKSAARTHD